MKNTQKIQGKNTLFNYYKDLSSFFYYINLPTCSSTAIIKKTFSLIDDDINQINFNLLKSSCTNLRLNWNVELSIIRSYLKDWYMKNYSIIHEKYPLVSFPNKFNLLAFIKNLYIMYKTNNHYAESFIDIYDVVTESINDQMADKRFMKETNILYITD